MQEFEIKILEIDTPKILAQLEWLGAKKIFDAQIRAEFFVNEIGKKVRLRQSDGGNTITYKERWNSNGVIHNTEHETAFADYNSMKNLLLGIGFVQYGNSQKYRISYQWEDIHFDIDTYPGIPTFIEVESTSREGVERGVKLIGYTMNDARIFTERTLKEYYGLSTTE